MATTVTLHARIYARLLLAAVLASQFEGLSAQGSDDLLAPPSADVPLEAGNESDPPSSATLTPPADDGRERSIVGGPEEPAASIARIAEESPLPLEEVIVINESEWRLPDLGSEWRREQAEPDSTDRIELSILPIYDPENSDPVVDLFERNSELHRVGMIDLLRVKFGGRPEE